MSDEASPSLLILPVELVYCALDKFDELTIILSARDILYTTEPHQRHLLPISGNLHFCL
jgi:hypothetical protein